uniref:Contactin 2 n=1 Tax=Cyprinus carpio carpio TaxID=630221 RepID=A0A8C1HXG4_CYPCA
MFLTDSNGGHIFVGGDVCVSGHDSGPVFEEQPSSLIYPEGMPEGKVTLSCQARAIPATIYRWRVNGTEIAFAEDSQYTQVAGNLVINNPQNGRDGGSYQCLAINRCGTIVSRVANLKFGYLHDFPPESRSPQTVHEGTGTFLACQPPAHYPALSYRWFINEFPNFIQPEAGRWFVSQVTGNLYLANAKANDTGNYFCFTTINMDISTKSIFSKAVQLTVYPDANPRKASPNIRVRFPAETYALTGQTAQLECFAYGNPIPKIHWRKVGGILPPKVGASAEGPILIIPELNFDDEGMYECEVYNSEGRETHQGRISVQAQPEWLQVMSDSEVEISSELQWSCAAAGKPRPTIHWLRNGQPLITQDRVEVNNGRLRISNLALEDSGMYQCVAENKHGTIYSNAELRVQVQAPDFRLNPVRRLVPAARGGQVKMECKPRAAPKPTLFWSRGTELLTNSTRITVTPDGVLWIYNISRSDEGKYTCFAENYLGKANSTGHLSVRDATKITLAPSNADINQGENASLQCHASHDPTMDLTFTWSLNGVPLDLEEPNGHYRRMEGKETIGDLVIVNGQLSHAGTYTCTAQTVVDSAVASAKLVVRGPPGPPGGLVVTNVDDTSVELRWSHGYDNHSPIGKYVILGRSSQTHDWKRMRTDPANIEGNAESARVIDLRPWMDYEFQVIASNILGSGEPSMASQSVRTKQAAPTVAPSGLGGGGGNRNELIITWTPMAREYQNGDGFGYILAFRKQGMPTWTVVRVPHVESSRYVYSNESLSAYCPFEVRIKAYNKKGEGPFSQIAVVHSAEEEPIISPRRINATALTAFEIQVSWDPIQHLIINGVLRGYEVRHILILISVTSLFVFAMWIDKCEWHDRVDGCLVDHSGPVYFVDLPLLVSSLLAPSRPPGNISWKVDGSWVTVRWDHVKSMDNESTVLGYKVSDTLCHPTLRLSLKMCVCVGLTIPICMSPEYLLRFSTGMMVQKSAGTSGSFCTSVLAFTALVLIGSSGL